MIRLCSERAKTAETRSKNGQRRFQPSRFSFSAASTTNVDLQRPVATHRRRRIVFPRREEEKEEKEKDEVDDGRRIAATAATDAFRTAASIPIAWNRLLDRPQSPETQAQTPQTQTQKTGDVRLERSHDGFRRRG